MYFGVNTSYKNRDEHVIYSLRQGRFKGIQK